jgi:hypothetical protein
MRFAVMFDGNHDIVLRVGIRPTEKRDSILHILAWRRQQKYMPKCCDMKKSGYNGKK